MPPPDRRKSRRSAGLAGAREDALKKTQRAWKRLRSWRRLRFTSGGTVLTLGSMAVGFAAVNTGNNLLYLLLGATLGLIAVSGWFSERTIRDLEVLRQTPRGVSAGQDVRIAYQVRARGRYAAMAVEISEQGLAGKAFVPRVEAGGTTTVRSYNRFTRRGVYPLQTITLSTTFPFGLFVKERDLSLDGELVIWPRADRRVRPPTPAGRPPLSRTLLPAGGPGQRGEYRALHEYRAGDDARDIHWKATARLQTPVVREYESEATEEFWICLDTRGEPGEHAERLIEVAASLASSAAREGRPFGLIAAGRVIGPASGPGHLELVLDFLARVDFRPDAPAPGAPAGISRPVVISSANDEGGYLDAFTGHGS